MEKLMAILTKDVAFGHTLAEYITNSHVLKYKILSFYDEADYMQFKDSHVVDVLLADEDISPKRYLSSEGKIFLLTEEKRNEANRIFKYQSMETTIRELSFKLNAGREDAALENHSFVIKSVISAKGGSGVTSFSLSLAGTLGKKQGVLLVCLDPFAEMPPDFEKGDGELSELIYSIKLGNICLSGSLGDCIRHGGDFDYISGVLNFEDLYSFGKEEMRGFLAALAADGRYSTVIFDLGRLPPCSEVILEKSEMVYVIGDGTSNLENQLKSLFGEDFEAKIKTIGLPIVEQFKKGIPAYADFENTEYAEFTETLLKDEKSSLTDEKITLSKSVPMSETPLRESEKSYTVTGRGFFNLIGMKSK